MKARLKQFAFDIDQALNSVVPISARIPEDAMTASLLGTERSGHGVIIRADGLVVTIGYLIAEAESVWIGAADDALLPGYVVGYDFETGFGLIRPTEPLDRPCLVLGRSADLKVGDPVIVAGSGGTSAAIQAQIAAKQEFAGRWEYLLDEAIYTVPAHTDWAGAALIDRRGGLCGIGSLLVQDGGSGETGAGANLFVPIDILVPIIDEICEFGRQRKPPRPWLGLLIHDSEGQLIIVGVYRRCPGDKAGLKPGDVITELDGRSVGSLANFFRQMWALGSAGVQVPLTVSRDGETHRAVVHSADRAAFFRKGTVN